MEDVVFCCFYGIFSYWGFVLNYIWVCLYFFFMFIIVFLSLSLFLFYKLGYGGLERLRNLLNVKLFVSGKMSLSLGLFDLELVVFFRRLFYYYL